MEQEVSSFFGRKKDEKKTLPEVIIAQIDKCTNEFSKEMKKGYETSIQQDGKWFPVTLPDQRKTVIQCVQTLHDILLFYFDEEIKKSLKKIETDLEGLYNKFLVKFIKQEPVKIFREYTARNKSIHPKFDTNGIGSNIYQEYWNARAEIYREMFQELVLLFKRKNELSGKRTLGYKDM